MAHVLNVSESGYGKIERDETEVTLDRLEQIANALNVNVKDILEFEEATSVHISQPNSTFQNGVVNNYGITGEGERKLYEDKIGLLEDKVKLLEDKIKMLEKELGRLRK